MLEPVKDLPTGNDRCYPQVSASRCQTHTVPIGKSPQIRAWVTSKILPVGQAPGIGLGGGVGVGVGLGEVLLFVV